MVNAQYISQPKLLKMKNFHCNLFRKLHKASPVFFIVAIMFSVNIAFSQEYGLGAIPVGKAAYKKMTKIKRSTVASRVPLPLRYFLDTPPPGNQGNMGSCVGWAVGYTFFSSFIRKIAPLPNPAPIPPRPQPQMIWNEYTEMSPSYIFNQIKSNPNDCTQGTSVPQALNLLKIQGDCPVNAMAYKDGDCNTQPSAANRAEASRYHSSPHRPWWPADPKDYLLFMNSIIKYKRPVIVVLPVYQEFDDMWNYKKGMWTQNPPVNQRGYHCVCIVGYDAKKKLFKCQNQWGDAKGDNGFFWVTFNLVQQGCFIEAYIWIEKNPNPVPVPFPLTNAARDKKKAK